MKNKEIKKIQIIEMLRNIYEINNRNAFNIYNKIIENKSIKEIDIIFDDLSNIINNKNEITKKLAIDLNKIYNNFEEKNEKYI
ncbi:MAG: hypothetical protein Q9M94_01950 [Candidatus Gracilibacteria bacterium]|nr:hypothetical protein [Candidatus Gracilibacteria bacterium]